MSNAVVPYVEMEKMAKAVATSKLFGVKTPDEAMSLMLVAQAEGVHPMTAVRDYHIISGKPSLKADTMLARFLADGGKVEWHSYTDDLCDATFTHPAGGKVRVDWTFQRAQKAGLTSKDVWKGYSRAMLRSRVISEAVRTVCPGVISGIYTPEELSSVDPEVVTPVSAEQAVQSFAEPIMASDIVADYIASINDCQDQESLKRAYTMAFKAAKDARDERRMGTFTLAYDARKEELSTVPPTEPSI